jgi:hypothetical protein
VTFGVVEHFVHTWLEEGQYNPSSQLTGVGLQVSPSTAANALNGEDMVNNAIKISICFFMCLL